MLLRLIDEDGALVPPAVFMPNADRHHLIPRTIRAWPIALGR